jgi:hypothetical protein
MTSEKFSKKLILVNRDFQFRYARVSVAVGLVSTALTSVVILYPLYLFKILVVPRFLPTPILLSMVAAAMLNISMIIVFGILISHKIAGPMFSMVRHFRKIAGGTWRTEMRTRPGDDLGFVVRNLNELSDALVSCASNDLELVNEAIESCKSEESKSSLIKLQQQIAQRIKHHEPSVRQND